MQPKEPIEKTLIKIGSSILGGLVLTFFLFLVLPLTQTIGDRQKDDSTVRPFDVAQLPPPPPPPEPEEEEEEPEEEEPPELQEEMEPLSLDQLELALNPGMGGLSGDFGVKLNIENMVSKGISENFDQIFSMSDLDQRPQAVYQTPPVYPMELRKKKKQGKVIIVFVVDKRGRVKEPKVQNSSDPGFNKAALNAVKQWKFKPGRRDGKEVASKMKIPINFAL